MIFLCVLFSTPICSVTVCFLHYICFSCFSFFLFVSIIWNTLIYYTLPDSFIKFFPESFILLFVEFPKSCLWWLISACFCIFFCELIFNRALFVGIMPWLRVGLFRVLYFFCQMSQDYCKPETTFCVQFLLWGFSDHVVVQFESQISLWKDLWLQIIKADAFFLSVQSFLFCHCVPTG